MHSGAEWAFRLASEICRNPNAVVTRWKSLSGRKVSGCVPIFLPEEILHAAGMLPVTIWGNEFPHSSHAGGTPVVCSVAGGILSAIRSGEWGEIDVWAFPAACDTFRNVFEEYFPENVECPRFPFAFPDSADTAGTAEYMLDRVEEFCEWAGRVSGREVSEGSLERSVRMYNENRQSFGLLEERMAESPGSFSGKEFATLARAGMVMPKEGHTQILTAALSRSRELSGSARPKVFLMGMMATDPVTEALDEKRAAIVGNDLALGHRYYSGSPEEAGDMPLSLSRRHLRRDSCFTLHGAGRRPIEGLFRRIVACGTDRLILLRMNGCEPESWDIHNLAAESRVRGIPFLCIDLGPQASERAKAKERIETFLDLGE